MWNKSIIFGSVFGLFEKKKWFSVACVCVCVFHWNGNQRVRFTALRPQFKSEESVLKPFLKSLEFRDLFDFFGYIVEFWWKLLKYWFFLWKPYTEIPTSPPNYDVCIRIDSIFTFERDTKKTSHRYQIKWIKLCSHSSHCFCFFFFIVFYQKISLLTTWNVKKIYWNYFGFFTSFLV